MRKKQLVADKIRIAVAALFSAVIAASLPILTAAESPPESFDGLVPVPDSKVHAAYINPDADFSVYRKVMILDCYVAFKKDWQRTRTRSGSRVGVSSSEMEKIKADVAGIFRDVFVEKLQEDDGYEVVYTPGDDVLLIRPAIIDLDVVAPDVATAGRTYTYTSTTGAATLYIELYDSVTGDILARAADRRGARTISGYLQYTTRVTNRRDARRVIGKWAELLRDRLDEFTTT